MRTRSKRLTVVLLTSNLLTACAHPLIQVGPASPPIVNVTVSSACGWESVFYPDQKPTDYAYRWTDNEMRWLKTHNDLVHEFCPPAQLITAPTR